MRQHRFFKFDIPKELQDPPLIDKSQWAAAELAAFEAAVSKAWFFEDDEE